VIDVEHRPLRPFKEDPAAGPPQLREPEPDGLGERQELGRQLAELVEQRLAVDLVDAEAAAERVVVEEKLDQLLLEHALVGEVAEADGAPRHLVLVGGADAAAGGADLAGPALGPCARIFPRAIELAVERQDDGGVLCDPQRFGANGDPLAA
jgi:hypothetical protein